MRSWEEKNWKLVIPSLCLALILVFTVIAAAFLAFISGMLKDSEVYRDNVTVALNDPRVIELLGAPVSEGILFSGSVNTRGDFGEADFTIPLSGPEGRGTLYIAASRSAGRWSTDTLVVEENSGKIKIDLLLPAKEKTNH